MESSRIVPVTSIGDLVASSNLSSVGEKRKMPDGGYASSGGKAPLGMWDAFGDDIAKFGYGDTKDIFLDSSAAGSGGPIPKP